jgi:DNA-binding transcriptional MerR regulator
MALLSCELNRSPQLTTIDLTKGFGLSRSTLISYDKLSLLKPAVRSDANYRRYTAEDHQLLAKIMTHRDTGMSDKDMG